MSCKWIRFKDQRRATYCQDAKVLLNCPITCGECCEDNSHYTFEVSEVDNKQVKCDWLTPQTADKYCGKSSWSNGKMVRDGCPRSCDYCEGPPNMPSVVPTVSPSSTPTASPSVMPTGNPMGAPSATPSSTPFGDNGNIHCHNLDTYRHEGDQDKTCEWIRNEETRRSQLCQLDDVFHNCPISCGQCCADDHHYIFDNGSRCDWLVTLQPAQLAEECSKSDNGKIVRVACPEACGHCLDVPTESHCHDIDTYRHNDNDEMSCKWIRSTDERRSTYCQDTEVLSYCPITCGECCEDNSHYTFEVSLGITQNCDWLTSATTDEYCGKSFNGKMVREGCPLSCNYCNTPQCKNNDLYRYDNVDQKSCKWIARTDSDTDLCQHKEVQDNCPIVCGICCEDDAEYLFRDNQVYVGCNSISNTTETRHDAHDDGICGEWKSGRMVRDACPKACNVCEEVLSAHRKMQIITSPSLPAPISSIAPTTEPCHNNDLYRYPGDEKKSCKWIRNRDVRREKYCQDNEVKRQCPITCGECCEDNEHYSFLVGTKLESCEWLSPSTSKTYCEKYMVRDACPRSCGTCMLLSRPLNESMRTVVLGTSSVNSQI